MTENISLSGCELEQHGRKLSKWSELGVHCYIKMFVIAVLFYVYYKAEINKITGQWSDPSWSHGFIIPMFSLYFLNQSKNEILNLRFKLNYLGLLLLVLGLLFYPLNLFQIRFGYLSPLSMVATLGAVMLFMGGWKLVKYTWLPIGYLFFAIPLPGRYYRMITIPMRMWASSISAGLLNLVSDIQATANGVIINVIYKGKPVEPALNVAEACSGMRLLMAFVALGVAMAYLHRRPIWQRLVLLGSTIPIAILCNIVRVTITGFIYVLPQIDSKYAQGIYHDSLGMVMLVLAFTLYGAMAWFMSNILVDEKQPASQEGQVIIRRKKGSE